MKQELSHESAGKSGSSLTEFLKYNMPQNQAEIRKIQSQMTYLKNNEKKKKNTPKKTNK